MGALLAVLASPALAFHSGGSARCEGCHSMHGSSDKKTGAGLVQGADASSTCLLCHAAIGSTPHSVLSLGVQVGTPPVNYPPGGDFAWVDKTFTWIGSAGLEVSAGDRHGHNVVAADFGRTSDRLHTSAPGGTYPSNQLSCISCHDPHGRYRDASRAERSRPADAPVVASGSVRRRGRLHAARQGDGGRAPTGCSAASVTSHGRSAA